MNDSQRSRFATGCFVLFFQPFTSHFSYHRLLKQLTT